MNFDVYLVGVGGQGVLTVAEFIAEAAVAAGLPVNFYPSKGMAQRGGFVKAQVRIGREVVGPNIPERGADLVIATERSEALKAVRYVKPGNDYLLYDDVWSPTAVTLGRAPYPALDVVQAQILAAGARLLQAGPKDLPIYAGQPVSDNVFVLGLALQNTRLGAVLDREMVAGLIARRWPRVAERNVFGFRAGLEARVEELAPHTAG